MTERQRRTDQRQNLDDLDAIYKRFEKEEVYRIPSSPVEPPPTPPPGAENDPWFLGKEIAVRITKFIALCTPSFQADPAQIYFATELAALNVFNAQDAPIPKKVSDAARKAAYDYYTASLPYVPDRKK